MRTNWRSERTITRREDGGDDNRRSVSTVAFASRSTFLQGGLPTFSRRTDVAVALVILCLIVTCLDPTDALAHARWFIDDTQIVLHPAFKFDGLYLAMLVGAVLFMLVALT